ncbi:hypothetical protein DIPPA_14205 [Diplonema papillatum]|nr:hypothetical protein DIPPA_14205 [Diplonema papillatum]
MNMQNTIAMSAAVGILGGVGITACLCRRKELVDEEECDTERHGLSSVESEEEEEWKTSTPDKMRPRVRSLPGAVPAVRMKEDLALQRAVTFNIKSSPRRRATLGGNNALDATPRSNAPLTPRTPDTVPVSPSRLSASYLSAEAASLASRTVCSHLRRTRIPSPSSPVCQLDRT